MERRGDAAISFAPRHRVSRVTASFPLLLVVDVDVLCVDDIVFAARLSG